MSTQKMKMIRVIREINFRVAEINQWQSLVKERRYQRTTSGGFREEFYKQATLDKFSMFGCRVLLKQFQKQNVRKVNGNYFFFDGKLFAE